MMPWPIKRKEEAVANAKQRKRAQGKESKWIERMNQWEGSGLGPRAFCKRPGYREARFHWWRRVLQEMGKWKLEDSSGDNKDVCAAPKVPFSQIQINPPQQKPHQDGRHSLDVGRMIEMDIGDEYRIRVPSGFDPSTLDRILTVPEERSCSVYHRR